MKFPLQYVSLDYDWVLALNSPPFDIYISTNSFTTMTFHQLQQPISGIQYKDLCKRGSTSFPPIYDNGV